MKSIYMVGICGTGMGNLAMMLKNKGYNVTGSDSGIYPPMSDLLKKGGIKTLKGYSSDNIKKTPDLAIIGNVVRGDNPEAKFLIDSGIPYYSLPEALREFFFIDKKTVVISGTHGKTTTSFMTAWFLENSGLKPGFFVGGVPKDFEVMGRSAEGDFFVIEGDEYDTAFFDKVPKFFHYKPEYLIITSIEFDHADIYPDLNTIRDAFAKLISMVPKTGCIIYNAEDDNIRKLIQEAECKTISFSASNRKADFKAQNIEVVHGDELNRGPQLRFEVLTSNARHPFVLNIPGSHNVSNALSVIALSQELGLGMDKARHALSSFRGVKRRQDVYGVSGGRIIIDDFAHHPTAVSCSIDAIREWYWPRRVWCVFEPRTATTRTNILQSEIIDALSKAEKVLLAPVHEPERVEPEKRFEPHRVCSILKGKGIEADSYSSVNSIVEHLGLKTTPGDVILIMSNGGFGDIYNKLMDVFKWTTSL